MKQGILKSLTAAVACVGVPSMATANVISAEPSFVDIVFEGTVNYRIDDKVEVRNPDGSIVEFDRSAFGSVGPAEGESVSIKYTFSTDDPAFSNDQCGGRFALNTAGRASGSGCTVTVTPKIVTDSNNTGFSGFTFGGSGGDQAPFVSGLYLQVDPATGEYTLDIPDGEYSVGYAAVRDYQYDSFTQTLMGPGFTCVSTFNCLDDVGVGTADRLSFGLQITGDLGTVRPGFNVGYNAGSAGFLDILGAFSVSSVVRPVPVPAPGMLLLFGLAAAVVPLRRKLAVRRAPIGQ